MLKKRLIAGVLVMLSFFSFGMNTQAFSIKDLFGGEYVAKPAEPRIKMYMHSGKMLPVGGVTDAKLKCSASAKDAAKLLYDGNTDKAVRTEADEEITLDMGMAVLLSHIRYYAGEIGDGNNCLGARFYASNNNRNFVELAVIENQAPPENAWNEIYFDGFGEYRYFKVCLPQNSNICEIEWMGAEGFSKTRKGSKYDIKFSLCGYDAIEDIDATIVMAEYNKEGVAKQIKTVKKVFAKGETENFILELGGADGAEGDSYRIIIYEKSGAQTLKVPLRYRVNGAARGLSVSSAFGDNMVLQADKPAVIWGKAPEGTKVGVTIEGSLGGGVTRSAIADKNFDWEVNLGTFSAGGDYTLKIEGDGREYKYKNITFGDVWLCTGQSNMEYYMVGGDKQAATELADKESIRNENIRLLNLFNKGIEGAAMPVDNALTDGTWYKADEETTAYCTAVGYFFAKEIEEVIDLPVGIINVAVGDTEINRWIAKGEKCGSFTSTDGDLYNNRIYPFEKLNLKGIILYQGEADQYRTHLSAGEYSDAMAGLVDNYRKVWGEDLPFYWAQLTRYRIDETLVREGQRLALSKVSNPENTGMITLIDLMGNYEAKEGSCRNDIHPWGKETVGERFAAFAKRDCYGVSIAVTGPVYQSTEISGGELILTFECDGKLRVMPKDRYADKITDKKIKDEKIDVSAPMEFEIAGEDGNFVPATARLDGKTVILKSESVPNPVYARYAWGAYPEMPNLTDDTGLPCPTFTTENLN